MREREKVDEETTGKKEGKEAGALSLTRKKMEEETSGEKEASFSCERRSRSSFSHANERAPSAPLEKPCEQLAASSAPPSGVRLLFNPPELSDLGAVRFGNITELLHCTSPCNHLEKERDACSVPTQPLAETMPVETIDNVAAGIFLLVLRRTFACPMRILPKKRSEAAFLAAFPISAGVKGIDVFPAQRETAKVSFGTLQWRRRRRHCFFFLSVFSQAYLCPRRSANQDGAEEERSCPCPRGGHDERKSAAEGSRTGGLSSYYSSFRRGGRSYLRGRKYLSALFFRIPSRRLLPLLVVLTLRSATIAFFFFFLASRSCALAYIFEKGSSLAVPVAFYIAADDKGERSVNRIPNRTRNP